MNKFLCILIIFGSLLATGVMAQKPNQKQPLISSPAITEDFKKDKERLIEAIIKEEEKEIYYSKVITDMNRALDKEKNSWFNKIFNFFEKDIKNFEIEIKKRELKLRDVQKKKAALMKLYEIITIQEMVSKMVPILPRPQYTGPKATPGSPGPITPLMYERMQRVQQQQIKRITNKDGLSLPKGHLRGMPAGPDTSLARPTPPMNCPAQCLGPSSADFIQCMQNVGDYAYCSALYPDPTLCGPCKDGLRILE